MTIIKIVAIIVILALLGYNIFTYLAKGTDIFGRAGYIIDLVLSSDINIPLKPAKNNDIAFEDTRGPNMTYQINELKRIYKNLK